MTLDKFYTDTKVSYDGNLDYDEFYLDGSKVDDKEALRVFKFMDYIRKIMVSKIMLVLNQKTMFQRQRALLLRPVPCSLG